MKRSKTVILTSVFLASVAAACREAEQMPRSSEWNCQQQFPPCQGSSGHSSVIVVPSPQPTPTTSPVYTGGYWGYHNKSSGTAVSKTSSGTTTFTSGVKASSSTVSGGFGRSGAAASSASS